MMGNEQHRPRVGLDAVRPPPAAADHTQVANNPGLLRNLIGKLDLRIVRRAPADVIVNGNLEFAVLARGESDLDHAGKLADLLCQPALRAWRAALPPIGA